MDPTPLHLAGRYRLYEQIGRGDVATVWLAWDELLSRLVAVKVVRAPMLDDMMFRTRFLEEVRAAARLSHPGIVAVYDFGEHQGDRGRLTPYVVMELLEGRDLAARIGRESLPWREAVRICAQVASALAYAHGSGVAHEGLKSSNVFLTPGGVKVLDFGLARARGGPALDAVSADIRALGMLLAEMLTGRRDSEPRFPPSVPPAAAAICRRCLSPDPAARPTAAEVATLLSVSLSDGQSVAESSRIPWPKGDIWQRKKSFFVAVVALTVVTILALVVNAGFVDRSARTPMAEVSGPSTEAPPRSASYGEPPVITIPPTAAPEQPTTSGSGEPQTPRPTPRPSQTRPPSAPPAPADPVAVLRRAEREVQAGVGAGDIRSDVGLDLSNVLGNLRRELEARQQVDLGARVAEIRNKINTRVGENGITRARADRLLAILADIDA